MIFSDQSDQPLRFKKLLKSLKPISSRTLSLKLKILESYEIVERNIKETSPPHVKYNLTIQGKAFTEVLKSFSRWAEDWYN